MDEPVDNVRDFVSAAAEKTKKKAERQEAEADCSEDKLAIEAFDMHGAGFRYVIPWGKWYRWVASRWEESSSVHMYAKARLVCQKKAATCAGEKTLTTLGKAKTFAAIEQILRSEERLEATIDQWDADPFLLNTPAGIVDLRTGILGPSDPKKYCVHQTAVAPSVAIDCQIFLRFLKEVTLNDAQYIEYFQRWFGYCLTGDTSEQAMVFAYGTGSNGKTTLFECIGGVMGSYRKTAPMSAFVASQNEQHPTDIAGLRGARLAISSETEKDRKWAEAKIKALTGGDMISARKMKQDFSEFKPTFKLAIFGNNKPGLTSVDEAIRRRIQMLPFNATFSDEQKDPALPEKLKAEWPGILRWCIEGCLKWQTEMLNPPEAIVEATKEYFSAEDHLTTWVEEACILAPDEWETTERLFSAWKSWATAAGIAAGEQGALRQAIQKKLGRKVKPCQKRDFSGKLKRSLSGIALIKEQSEDNCR